MSKNEQNNLCLVNSGPAKTCVYAIKELPASKIITYSKAPNILKRLKLKDLLKSLKKALNANKQPPYFIKSRQISSCFIVFFKPYSDIILRHPWAELSVNKLPVCTSTRWRSASVCMIEIAKANSEIKEVCQKTSHDIQCKSLAI